MKPVFIPVNFESRTRIPEPISAAVRLGGPVRPGQRLGQVHRDHTVAAAVDQRLPVHVGQLGGGRGRRGGLAVLVDVVRNVVHAVAQIGVVEQDVQGDFAYPPLPPQFAREGVPTNR